MAQRKTGSKSRRVISAPVAAKVREAIRKLSGDERRSLFIPHIDKIREITSLEFNPGDAETYAALIESICGVTDDSQPVEQYDGTLGVTIAFANAHQAPVGQLQWNNNLAALYTNPGNVSGARWCTGTLISNDLFLSAGHCFDQTGGGWVRPVDNATGATISNAEIATNMHVNFNYQVDPAGTLRVEQVFPIVGLVEYRLGGLDFAIIRLSGNPGATFGITQVSTTDAAVGDMLCIIGHPAGWPKRIEAGPTVSLTGNSINYDDIDTLGGNSGSGILRATDGRIVGVHTNGGCNAAGTGANSGVRITSIIAQSPTLQALTTPKLKFVDDPKFKFRDDHGTVKFREDHAKLKFRDDHITLKFLDDGGTSPFMDLSGTHKAVDDVKQPALDKQFGDRKLPGRDGPVSPLGFRTRPWDVSAQKSVPFVLSTPHHSMAWARGSGSVGAVGGMATREVLARYEEALTQLESNMQQGLDQITELDAEYRQLLAEYEELASGQG